MKRPPQAAVAPELSHVLLEHEVTENLGRFRIERRPHREARERDERCHQNPGNIETQECTPLETLGDERIPGERETHGRDEGKRFEQTRDTQRESDEHPKPVAFTMLTPHEHERKREKNEECFRKVRQKRPAVLKARVKPKKRESADIPALEIAREPSCDDERKARGEKGAHYDRKS